MPPPESSPTHRPDARCDDKDEGACEGRVGGRVPGEVIAGGGEARGGGACAVGNERGGDTMARGGEAIARAAAAAEAEALDEGSEGNTHPNAASRKRGRLSPRRTLAFSSAMNGWSRSAGQFIRFSTSFSSNPRRKSTMSSGIVGGYLQPSQLARNVQPLHFTHLTGSETMWVTRVYMEDA
jgi:hypothetical protein